MTVNLEVNLLNLKMTKYTCVKNDFLPYKCFSMCLLSKKQVIRFRVNWGVNFLCYSQLLSPNPVTFLR